MIPLVDHLECSEVSRRGVSAKSDIGRRFVKALDRLQNALRRPRVSCVKPKCYILLDRCRVWKRSVLDFRTSSLAMMNDLRRWLHQVPSILCLKSKKIKHYLSNSDWSAGKLPPAGGGVAAASADGVVGVPAKLNILELFQPQMTQITQIKEHFLLF